MRRPSKLLMLAMAAVLVVVVVVYEGNQLTGNTLRQKLSSYRRVLELDTEQPSVIAIRDHAPPRPDHAHLQNTTTPPPATTPVWQHPVYAERRHRTQNVCSRVRNGAVARLTRYGNTSYCVVPKVGCTFWINVFRFLHGDTGGKNVTSPFSINRHVTHYGPRKSMMYYSTNASYAPAHLEKDFRFMFVREPYSRLWSAYVDKFLLVDYWRSEGKNIVKLRKVKDNSTMCARDISFKEFVEFVATRKEAWRLNEHWKPIQFLCNPCMYQPHMIGKMETFPQDSRYVLRQMNVSWILDTYDHQLHVYQEMDMLIEYNFQLIKSKSYHNCTNATDLARRLWRTFQINGYIPVETAFPEHAVSTMNITNFRSLAHQAYRTRPQKSKEEWQQQREQAMVDAFKDISSKTLAKLQDIYRVDFDMFGYDPQPDSIFAGRDMSAARRKS